MVSSIAGVVPCGDVRDKVREGHERAGLTFLEVFVDCPLETVEQR